MKVRIEVDCESWGHVQLNCRRENTSSACSTKMHTHTHKVLEISSFWRDPNQQGGRKSETPTSEQVVGVWGLNLIE